MKRSARAQLFSKHEVEISPGWVSIDFINDRFGPGRRLLRVGKPCFAAGNLDQIGNHTVAGAVMTTVRQDHREVVRYMLL